MANLACKENSDASAKSILRYGIVGVASNLLGYLVYLLITYLGVDFKVAMTFLYALATVFSYLGNRQWTFSYKGSVIFSSLRYMFAYGLGYLINLAILIVMVDRMGYPHQLAQAIAFIVVALFLFGTLRYFVFSKSPTEPVRT